MPTRVVRIDPVRSLCEFTVEGRGSFPIDMLRYDSCWPASESRDSFEITASTRPRSGRMKRRITLLGLREPTVGRWESFGWNVV